MVFCSLTSWWLPAPGVTFAVCCLIVGSVRRKVTLKIVQAVDALRYRVGSALSEDFFCAFETTVNRQA